MPEISPDVDGEQLPEPEMLQKQKEWTRKVQEMLLGYKQYKPNRELIDLFLTETFDFKIYNMFGHEIILNLIQYFQAGVTQPHLDLCISYFKIIKKVYTMLTEINKRVFHKHFIIEWQHHPIDYSPYFETLIPRYQDKIKELLDEIAENPQNVDNYVREEIRFLVLVTPVSTLLKICSRAIKNPALGPFVNAACYDVPELFSDNRQLSIWHNEYETTKLEPLLAVVFRRLIFNSRLTATSNKQWNSIEQMALRFCEGDKPLLGCWVMLDLVLCEIYTSNRVPTKSIEVLTGIASRLLSPANNVEFDWTFATSLRAQPAEKVFLTPAIIVTILDLMKEYHEKKNHEVVENCKSILQCLGNRMREENAEFDEETKVYLMEKLNDFPWWIEYAMSTWFWALNVVKRRVPSGFFKALCLKEEEDDHDAETPQEDAEDTSDQDPASDKPVKISDKFKAIPEALEDLNVPLPELYLRAILEIGLFDLECALELLHTKSSINFNEFMELEQLAMKLVKESFFVKMGLIGYEDARILLLQVLEIFFETQAVEGETVVKNILGQANPSKANDDTPSWTQELSQSLIIQPLRKTEKYVIPWPPAKSNFVQISAKRLRMQQKKQRETLLEAALKKVKTLAQHHRDAWVHRDAGEDREWICPESPPNESSSNYSFNSGGYIRPEDEDAMSDEQMLVRDVMRMELRHQDVGLQTEEQYINSTGVVG